MGMKSADQAESRGGWAMQVQDMRTVRALCADAPAPDAIERLSDRALRAAALNPDHSEAARAAAAEALRARRVPMEPWRLSVPGFIGAADLAKGERLFFGAAMIARRAFGLVAILGVAGLIGAVVADAFGLLPATIAADDGLIAALALVALVGGLGWFALRALRLKPARISVILPDVPRGERDALNRMVGGELRPFGHVVSLAAGEEGRAVRSAAGYRAAAGGLRNLVARNLRPLRLAACAAWRPLMLQLLADSADVIVVDVSNAANAPLPALRDNARRCVFVCLWGRLEEAETALAAAGVEAPCFYYAPDGEMQRRGQFRAALLGAMRATHAAA